MRDRDKETNIKRQRNKVQLYLVYFVYVYSCYMYTVATDKYKETEKQCTVVLCLRNEVHLFSVYYSHQNIVICIQLFSVSLPNPK